MKKENRKIAQQRKAQERLEREKREKRRRVLLIAGPIAAAVLLVVLVVVGSGSLNRTQSGTDSGDGTEAVSSSSGASASSEAEELYSTNSALIVNNGDTVNIDYVGSVDGVEFDGGNTHGLGADLTIGSHTYIDDFEDQLIGSHPGDTVEVRVTFPEDYGVEELNGKEALFEVTVNGIYL